MMRRGSQIRCLAAVAIVLLARSIGAEKPPMAHNNVDRVRLFEAAWAGSTTIPLAAAYAAYPAAYLLDTARMLRQYDRYARSKGLLLVLLERPLNDCETAEAKWELLQVCKPLREGPMVRRLYEEIVRDCPDHARALNVAGRLAASHHSLPITGTKADPDQAIAICEWVVSRYPNRQDDALSCRVQLGNLYLSYKRDWRAAQQQFLSIYATDFAALELPDFLEPDMGGTPQERLAILRKQWEDYRPRLIEKIVGTCLHAPDVQGALSDLASRYRGTDIETAAKKMLAERQTR